MDPREGAGTHPTTASAVPPVTAHGALAVKGSQIVDQHGEAVCLAGVSLFWSNNGWGGERFYNPWTVQYLQEHWNATLVRAALGVDPEGGYLTHPQENLARLLAVVDAAIERDMYVIIDWHSHYAERHTGAAVAFFESMARRYAHLPHVIYEIYNEPHPPTEWVATIKPYSERVIEAIREIDPDNLIVVGTPTWSRDVDTVSKAPIAGSDNIAYAFHFYAASHQQWLRDKAERALENGIALMVTEWGTVNENGDGEVAEDETLHWLDFLRAHRLSHCNWALNDKKEGASILRPGCDPAGTWTDADLTASGRFVRNIVHGWSAADGRIKSIQSAMGVGS